jgi:hypothetical protein
MTAPLNPAPTMQYLIPSMSDCCFEVSCAILAGCRSHVPPGGETRATTRVGVWKPQPLKNLMPSSNPRSSHDQVSTRFTKWR